MKPIKTEHYRPFAITSAKLKTELPDTFILDKLMCRSTVENMAEYMELVKDYDLVRSRAPDHTMSFTAFLGRQGGSTVEVVLAVDTREQQLRHVLVNGRFVFNCI